MVNLRFEFGLAGFVTPLLVIKGVILGFSIFSCLMLFRLIVDMGILFCTKSELLASCMLSELLLSVDIWFICIELREMSWLFEVSW